MEIRATTSEMLSRINAGWEALQSFLNGLSSEQMTIPTDDAGWTIKDHISHLVVWEDGIEALLQHKDRRERMGISADLWENGEIDAINDFFKQRDKDISLAEARQTLEAVHQRLLAAVSALSDDELNLPYKHYDSDSDTEEPVWPRIVGNTFGHYEEHIPWMQAIAEKG